MRPASHSGRKPLSPLRGHTNLLSASRRTKTRIMTTVALATIVSTRVTLLEEIERGKMAAHTRVHYRMLGRERRSVQFAVLSASEYRQDLEAELESRDYDGLVIQGPTDLDVVNHPDFHIVPGWVR